MTRQCPTCVFDSELCHESLECVVRVDALTHDVVGVSCAHYLYCHLLASHVGKLVEHLNVCRNQTGSLCNKITSLMTKNIFLIHFILFIVSWHRMFV